MLKHAKLLTLGNSNKFDCSRLLAALHTENAALHITKTKNAVESANRTKETELRK
jgi:hypothetical protein